MHQVAISASNTGGAWDNAKKYIEVIIYLFRCCNGYVLRSMLLNFLPLSIYLSGWSLRACKEPWTEGV